MNYTRKAAIGFLWVAIGTLFANIFSYLFRLLLAKNLSVDEYGLVFAVVAFFSLILIFATFGLSPALSKLIAEFDVRRQTGKIKEILGWATVILFSSSAIIMLLAFALADWLAAVYFDTPDAALLVRLYGLAFFLLPFTLLIRSTFRGKQRMDLEAAYQFFFGLSLPVTAFVLLKLGYGVLAAMYSYILMPILLIVLFSRNMYRLISDGRHFRLRKKTLKKLVLFGLPFTVTGFSATLLANTDTVLLTGMSSLYEVGLYQAALPTANILLLFGSILATVLLPLSSELWKRNKKDIITDSLSKLYTYAVMGFLPIVLTFIVYADFILNILFGNEFSEATAALQILAVGAAFLVFNAINSATLSGIGFPKENAKAIMGGVVVNIIANLLLIPSFGITGASIATMLSALVIFWLSIYYIKRHISCKFPWKNWLKTLVAAVLFITILAVLRHVIDTGQYLKIALSICISIACYAAIVFWFRIVTKKEVKDLLARLMIK